MLVDSRSPKCHLVVNPKLSTAYVQICVSVSGDPKCSHG